MNRRWLTQREPPVSDTGGSVDELDVPGHGQIRTLVEELEQTLHREERQRLFQAGGRAVARPRPLGRMGAEPGLDRIANDVSRCPEQLLGRLLQYRSEAISKGVCFALVPPVDSSRMSPVRITKRPGKHRVWCVRCSKEKMDVICHQRKRKAFEFVALADDSDIAQHVLPVEVETKERLPIAAAGEYVIRACRQPISRRSWHSGEPRGTSTRRHRPFRGCHEVGTHVALTRSVSDTGGWRW